MIAYAQLTVEYDVGPIQSEVSLLTSGWQDHFNTRHYTGEWTVLPLRSPGGSADTIIPDPIFDKYYYDTPLMDQCLTIKTLLSTFKCEILSARLLNLKKGAVIKEHSDNELAFEKGEARIHFPIFTNSDVEFYLDGERVIMNEGECWYINANRKHRVVNNGTTDRIHLVVDCVVNDWLTELFDRSAKRMVPPLKVMEDWEHIIKNLREQNTPATITLADDMEGKLNKALAEK